MLQQITTARSGASFLYSRYKALIILQHAVNRLLNNLLGISAGATGELLNTGFFIRAEMYFHAASVGAWQVSVKPVCPRPRHFFQYPARSAPFSFCCWQPSSQPSREICRRDVLPHFKGRPAPSGRVASLKCARSPAIRFHEGWQWCRPSNKRKELTMTNTSNKGKSAETGKPPVAKLRIGLINANIWERPTAEKGTFYSASFERRYRSEERRVG